VRCGSCGHDNLSDARFCDGCGAPLVAGVQPPGTYPWVFVVSVAIAAGLFALFFLALNRRAENVEEETPRKGITGTPAPIKPRPAMISSDEYLAQIEGFAPLTVKLHPIGPEHSSEIGNLTFQWEFEEGKLQTKTGSGGRATYTYARPGIFHPKLRVSDAAGEIARQVWEVCVLPQDKAQVIDNWQGAQRDSASNLDRAKVYFSIGADMQGIYYSLRSFLADKNNLEAISALSDKLGEMSAFAEYEHFFLAQGAALEGPESGFAQTLDEKISGWTSARDNAKAELNRAEYRSSTAVSALLKALSALHDYEGALTALADSGLMDQSARDAAWYSLNIGKPKDALVYADKQLKATPNDLYALENKMLAEAISGDLDVARMTFGSYSLLNPPRGHVIQTALDMAVFSAKGLDSDFTWEILDGLRTFI